jgi:hypothetical protein
METKKDLSLAMKSLMVALSSLNTKLDPDSSNKKVVNRSRTKKGAKHIMGVQFKSRNTLSITPAKYRRIHMGSQKKKDKNGPKSNNQVISPTG